MISDVEWCDAALPWLVDAHRRAFPRKATPLIEAAADIALYEALVALNAFHAGSVAAGAELLRCITRNAIPMPPSLTERAVDLLEGATLGRRPHNHVASWMRDRRRWDWLHEQGGTEDDLHLQMIAERYCSTHRDENVEWRAVYEGWRRVAAYRDEIGEPRGSGRSVRTLDAARRAIDGNKPYWPARYWVPMDGPHIIVV